jgi:hypothetical protein
VQDIGCSHHYCPANATDITDSDSIRLVVAVRGLLLIGLVNEESYEY